MITTSLKAAAMPVKRRQTKARQRVLHLIQQQVAAVTPGDLERQLKPLMNRVTVYRALQVLLEEGLIGRLADGEYRVRYYARTSAEPIAVQFSCDLCHQLIAFPELAIALPVLPPSFQLNSGYVLITGLCPGCQLN